MHMGTGACRGQNRAQISLLGPFISLGLYGFQHVGLSSLCSVQYEMFRFVNPVVIGCDFISPVAC